VLLVGGLDDRGEPLSTAELFDPDSDSFAPVGALIHARLEPTATLLPDGRVLIAGGLSQVVSNRTVATAELFDRQKGTFGPAGALQVPRHAHAAVPLPDGRVAIVGGLDGGGRPVQQVEFYDPALGAFVAGGNLVMPRGAPAATHLGGGHILVGGGTTIGLRGESLAQPTLEIYHAATGTAHVVTRLSEARFGHDAVVLRDGAILFLGGWRSEIPPIPARSAELLGPNGRVIPAAPMRAPRAQAACVSLPDGLVLVVGGVREAGAGGDACATAELFVP
jgi:hypothetical protein